MNLKLIIIASFLCILSFQAQAKQTLLVNTSIIRGELFITPNLSERDINRKIERAFQVKNYKVVGAMPDSTDVIVIETFMYQFPYQQPTAVIIARSKHGVHYINRKSKALYFTVKDAFQGLLNDFIYEFPDTIGTSMVYDLTLDDVIYDSRKSFSAGYTKSILESFVRYNVTLEADNTTFDDLIFSDIDSYLLLSTNLSFLKGYLKGKSMSIHATIDKKGKLQFEKIIGPVGLTKQTKKQIVNLVRAVPTIFNTEMENIQIVIKN